MQTNLMQKTGWKTTDAKHTLNTNNIGYTYIDQAYNEIEFAQKLDAIT